MSGRICKRERSSYVPSDFKHRTGPPLQLTLNILGKKMSDNWCTIESDPGVFTELIEKIGVKNIEVEELYELELSHLKQLEPVFGLIFLFKWDPSLKDDSTVDANAGDVYFAKQVINNACATQAITSILLNKSDIDIGDELRKLKEFTGNCAPDIRGMALGNSESIRSVHNSFARPEPFIFEQKAAKKGDDVFHFISYVHINGRLFELDGLRDGPINHGACQHDEWLAKVIPVIQQRIDKYSKEEVHFNLLALIGSRKHKLEEELRTTQEELASCSDEAKKTELSARIDDLKAGLEEEQLKRAKWAKENNLRRHDYLPFIIKLCEILAETDKLGPLLESARDKAKQRSESAAKKT